MKTQKQKNIKKIIKEIAKYKLGINSLERRWNDDDDFYELGVWEIRAALEEAYNMGKKSNLKKEILNEK